MKDTWPQVEAPGRRSVPGWSSKTKPDSRVTQPIVRTCGRRGRTPVAVVRGRSRRRLSVAALACYKPGHRPRLIYRPSRDPRPDGRKGFAWTDCRDLIQAAHKQLGGPIVLVWDTQHTSGCRDWLTIYQLPAYAPNLNPVEGSGRCYAAPPRPTALSPTPTTWPPPSATGYANSDTAPTYSTAA